MLYQFIEVRGVVGERIFVNVAQILSFSSLSPEQRRDEPAGTETMMTLRGEPARFAGKGIERVYLKLKENPRQIAALIEQAGLRTSALASEHGAPEEQ